MTLARNTLVLAAAVFAISLTANQANAASYEHIDQLALRLQEQAGLLNREFDLHYRHEAHYPHLISDASQMYSLAAHIHEVAHHHGSPLHLRDDLQKLDRLFHHVEGLVEHIEHDSYFGAGHVHGHTGHVHGELAAMEDTLHHLQSDINAMYRTWYFGRGVRVYRQPVRVHSGHAHGGHGGGHGGHGGITFSKGGFSIRIGH